MAEIETREELAARLEETISDLARGSPAASWMMHTMRDAAAALRGSPAQTGEANAHYWFRESTQEWVLEINVQLPDFNGTHRSPGATKEVAFDALSGSPAQGEREKELERMVRRLSRSFECYTAQHKPESEWDEYDRCILPVWREALAMVPPSPVEPRTEGDRKALYDVFWQQQEPDIYAYSRTIDKLMGLLTDQQLAEFVQIPEEE